jgi:hypothetical protein
MNIPATFGVNRGAWRVGRSLITSFYATSRVIGIELVGKSSKVDRAGGKLRKDEKTDSGERKWRCGVKIKSN